MEHARHRLLNDRASQCVLPQQGIDIELSTKHTLSKHLLSCGFSLQLQPKHVTLILTVSVYCTVPYFAVLPPPIVTAQVQLCINTRSSRESSIWLLCVMNSSNSTSRQMLHNHLLLRA